MHENHGYGKPLIALCFSRAMQQTHAFKMSLMSSEPSRASSFKLSRMDVDRLMNDHSAKARTDILDKVAGQYRAQQFGEHELDIAEQIFRILMKDVEISVRAQLADELKDIPSVPRDIVLHLAKDVEEVSLPVLEMSQVLSDADLVYLVETSREMSKLEAVSKRGKVSERVSDALVESKYPQVIQTLMQNPGAKVSERAMETVVREFRRDEAVIESLAGREGLPLSVVEKLVHATSAKISNQLKERYNIDSQQLGKAEQKVREATMLKLLEGVASDDEIDALTAELYDENRLTPSIMFTALAQGQMTFFVFALARLVHIPRQNAMTLAMDKGGLGFKALYTKSELPESLYEAVRAMLNIVLQLKSEGVEPGTRNYSNTLATRLLMENERAEIENVPYMLALIRGGK